jgi:RimJ/RimL family protein N-acetyltransferase
MAEIYRSGRLIYRAVKPDDDLSFFLALNADRLGYQNSVPFNIHLPNIDDVKESIKHMSEGLVFAVVCLPNPSQLHPKAIGHITLDAPAKRQAHHRSTEIGIGILPEHQGKGYGSEVIRWALRYAFRAAGLHRVRIRALGWNEGAVRLYERLGFRLEGQEKMAYWHDGRWWDGFEFAMLEDEWRELNEEKA